MKTKRDFVRKRMGAAATVPAVKAARQSYFMGMDGVARPIKARGQSPLFLTFHGISPGRELNDTPYGLAQVYAASVLAWRCINVIADTFASLALRFTDGNNSDLPPDHPLCKALGKGGARLKRATAKDMQIWGVAYWEMTPHHRPLRLNPLTMEKEADKNGIRYFQQNVEGRQVTFPPERLLYFYDYDPMDDFGSVSPTQLALRSIGVETSLEEFVKTFLENYAIPAGLLTTDNHLQPSDAQRYKEDWKRRYGTEHIGDVAVLGHGLSFQTITPLLKDLVLDTLGESAARAVCQAYGVPLTMALATEAANYATFKESHQILYTETILPFADKVLGTINERPELWGSSIEVAVNEEEIAVLQEDRTEITTRAQMGFQAGYITLNEARDLENLAPLPGGDFVVIGGQFVTMQQIQSGQLPTPQIPFMSAQPQIPESTDKAVGNSFCLLFQIGADPDLIALQSQLRGKFEGANWNDPEDFHVTLVYCPTATEEQITQVRDGLAALDIPQPALKIGSLRSFDNLGEHALHFRLQRNPELMAFQHELYQLCKEAGMETSAYSSPAQYIPHITMGYSPTPQSTTFHAKLTVKPRSLQAALETAKDTYETVFEQTCGDHQIIDAPSRVETELRNWQRKATEKRKTAPFKCEFIPSATADFIRMDLAACDGTPDAIKAVFEQVGDDTPEEFERYWRGIGGLYDALARVFSTSFPDLRKRLAGAVQDGSISDVLAVWSDERLNELVGTEEEPGALVKVYLAGLARGNDLLENRRLTANPNKAVEAVIDWNVASQEAIEWARQYARGLLGGINDTTAQVLQDTTARWMSQGGSLDELAKVIEGRLREVTLPPAWSDKQVAWLTSPERVALIAQTETTRAFHEGVKVRWEQAGLSKMRFRTQNDRLVCQQCRRLNNIAGEIRGGFIDPESNKRVDIPVHGGCRCFAAPVRN